MQTLDHLFYGNTLRQWLVAALTAVVVLGGLKLVRALVVRRFAPVAERTGNDLDDLVVRLARRTTLPFFLVLALYAGTDPLSLPTVALHAFKIAAVVAFVAQAGLWGNAVVAFFLHRHLHRRAGDDDAAGATSLAALAFVGRLLVWSLLVLLGLDNLGIDVTALVAGLGVGGIAVALAVQNILGDLFASLSIVLDKPFVIGDFIVLDDYAGSVEHVGLKTTRLRSISGEQIICSNTDLLKSRIRNYKRMQERRVVFPLGVTYRTPQATLAAIPGMIREIIEAQPDTRFDRAHFKSFGPSSLDIEVVYHVLDADYNLYMDLQQTINLEIYRRFTEAHIDFAYPTQTVILDAGTVGEAGETEDSRKVVVSLPRQ